MHRRKILSLMAAVAAAGTVPSCGRRAGPTDPSAPGALPEWSPYLAIHPFDWQLGIQQPYLTPLFERGLVRGLRLDADGAYAERVAQWAIANGSRDVLGVFPNEFLGAPDVEQIFTSVVTAAPSIEYWEIGNEVENFIKLQPEEYMPVFLRIFQHARAHHPNLTVIPQPPIGGSGGDAQFRRMLDSGLLELARNPDPEQRVRIVALHYYSKQSTYLSEVKRQIERLPASVEIWITEAGINRKDGQIDFVRHEYPHARAMTRATRLYWYVFSECTDFSLVRGLAQPCAQETPTTSPLYQLLTRGGGA